MNPNRRKPIVLLFALLVTLGLSLGVVSKAPPAEAATGTTTIRNSIYSTCSLQIKYLPGPTYQKLAPGQGKSLASSTAIYWRFTDSTCRVTSVSPASIYTFPAVNEWRTVPAGSTTTVTVKY